MVSRRFREGHDRQERHDQFSPSKGQFFGCCNRRDCQEPGAIYWNRSMEQFYCRRCALRLLNPANRDCDTYLHDGLNGQPLCTLEYPQHIVDTYQMKGDMVEKIWYHLAEEEYFNDIDDYMKWPRDAVLPRAQQLYSRYILSGVGPDDHNYRA